MTYISKELKDQIKEIPITAVATSLGLSVRRNKSLCFTGHDRAPSLSFDPKKGTYHCFGCNISGDCISLVMKIHQKNFQESCRWLMEEFKIKENFLKIPSGMPRKILKPRVEVSTEIQEKKPNNEIYEWIIDQASLSKIGLEYLINVRGFKEATIDAFLIKDIINPDLFFRKLMNRWDKKLLLECGLLRIDDHNRIRPIWWDHVIIFPFRNLEQRIDYIQARRLSAQEPKYLNLAGVSPIIYNLQNIGTYLPGQQIFICEGIPDTISALQNNIKAVGILGANGFKQDWVKYFKDFQVGVIPDTDNGGRLFTEKIRTCFKNIGKSVKTIQLPDSVKDLNEYFNKRNNGTK